MELVLIPLTGALIGWLTNVLAIMLLFRPYRPLRIPLTGVSIQGLLPRRRRELATTIGLAVESELLSREEIMRRVAHSGLQDEVVDLVLTSTTRLIHEKVPAFFPAVVTRALTAYVTRTARQELDGLFAGSLDRLLNRMESELDIKSIVEQRIDQLDLAQLERLITGLARRELLHIQLLGGLIGFMIGLVQVVILWSHLRSE